MRRLLGVLHLSAIVVAVSGRTQTVRANPFAASDVEWGDTDTSWVAMMPAPPPGGGSGVVVPHVVFTSGKVGIGVNRVSISAWTGVGPDLWDTQILADNLNTPPMADAAIAGSNLHVVYNENGSLAWSKWSTVARLELDGAGGGPAVRPEVRPIVRLDSAGSAVVLYHHLAAGNAPRTSMTRVVEVPNPAFDPPVPLNTCQGVIAEFELDGADNRFIVCLHDSDREVNFVIADPALQNQQTLTLFGGNGNQDMWKYPSLTRDGGGNLHVVVLNETDDEIYYQFRSAQTGQWLAQPVVVDNVAARVNGTTSLDVSVHPFGASQGVGVAWHTEREIWYREFRGNPGVAFDVLARIDDAGRTQDAACMTYVAPIRIDLRSDGTVWSSWTGFLPANVKVNRFRQWKRSPPWTTSNTLGQLLNPHTQSSLALDAGGSPWTCFFDESAVAPPQIDLYLRYRANAPVKVATDVGLPSHYQRGCDIAVSPASTKIGVAYADGVAGQLRYLEAKSPTLPFVQFGGSIHSAADGPYPAAHVALAFGTDDVPRVVYAPYVGGWPVLRYAELDRTQLPPAWDVEVPVAGNKIGTYPDITTNPADGVSPLVSFYGTAQGAGRAYFVEKVNGVWGAFEPASAPDAGFDTSIAARMVGGVRHVWVAYYNYGAGSIQASRRVGALNWPATAFETVTPSSGEYVDLPTIAVDVVGNPIIAWRKRVSASAYVRSSRWGRFTGGRPLPGQPAGGGYQTCTLDTGGSPSLARDVFDNWRIVYKSSLFGSDILKYLSRP